MATQYRPAITHDFAALVDKHLRSVTDGSVVVSDKEMTILREDPESWWTCLNMKKLAVEGQLASRFLDGASVDTDKWRASALRFKSHLDQTMPEVALLVKRHNRDFFKDMVIEERNAYGERIRELETAILKFMETGDSAPLSALMGDPLNA